MGNERPTLAIVGGDFWKSPKTISLTVKNTGNKTISSFILTPEMFLTAQDLRRPFLSEWKSDKPIPPGEEQALEKSGTAATGAETILAWAILPLSVKYEDGTSWHAVSEGECFGVIWRDSLHPEMLALPPRQIEINPD